MRRITVVHHLSAERVESMARNSQAVVVDVRESSEYRAGHIPRSRHIPLSQLLQRLREVGKSHTVVIVCQSGSRSAHACEMLEQAGYSKVFNLSGGMASWRGTIDR
jgi:rhodanese-related sulfurtransferase